MTLPSNHRHWVNAEARSPRRAGFYRVATHPNALERFAHWNGKNWSHAATTAVKARMAVDALTCVPASGFWWSGLQECDRELFKPEEFGHEEKLIQISRWCLVDPSTFRRQLARLAGKV